MAWLRGVWERMRRSAYSAEAYREVAAAPLSSLLGYLAVLILIATVATTIATHIRTSRSLDELMPWIIENVPELHLRDGILSSPVSQPYVWEHEEFQFIVDTTGTITELDDPFEQGVLLTETELVYRQSKTQTRRYNLSDFPDMVLDETSWGEWVEAMKAWLWVVVGLMTMIWLWCFKLIQVMFWSLLGIVTATFTKRPLRFGALCNICIYALTIPFAVDVLIGILGGVGWGFGLVSLVLYGVYVAWGIFVQPQVSAASSA